jgi:transcriptional regulator with XRE-family HTH domain
MTNQYPIKFTTQLRQHLRALRKTRGLAQAQLGELVGVSQARIAEIEANPGLVSFDQLMQLFAMLDVTVVLNEEVKVEQQEKTNLQNNQRNNQRKNIGEQTLKTVVQNQELKKTLHSNEIEQTLKSISKLKTGNW